LKALLARPEEAPGSSADAPVTTASDAAPRLGDQAAVLLSGLSKLVLTLLAMILLLAPFGEGPSELFSRTSQIQEGLKIGEVSISPTAVLQALAVLGLSLLAVRLLKHWLADSYLPTTRLDAGMQSSAATLLGYLGYVLAVSLSLSAVGIGLDRIAWVASALSVGIGFGLQAVVSNFVSGLILLAERPVRVGDWVSLGTVEGDIRRINMRATEIQLGDRSTVIVPNSEFITKTVRNVTHANPLGLVQLKLPMPLATPAEAVRALLLGVFEAHPDVLEAPAPNVQLDGIDGGHLVFNATGFVASPRAAYGVRSALLFEALKKLAAANINLSWPPQVTAAPAEPAIPLPEAPVSPINPVRP
jgi:potassium-dependent mechanosensitive channel